MKMFPLLLFRPFLHFFSIKGRDTRVQYWLGSVGLFISLIMLYFSLQMVFKKVGPYQALCLAVLFIWLPAFGLNIRRLHDIGESAWWWCLWLFPFAGFFFFTVIGFFDGTYGPNRFGPDPKGRKAKAKPPEKLIYLMVSPLKKYATFKGRSNRVEFWFYMFGVCLVSFVFLWISYAVVAMCMAVIGFSQIMSLNATPHHLYPGILMITFIVAHGVFGTLYLPVLLPTLAITSRRLHDIDCSAKWLILLVVPVCASLYLHAPFLAKMKTAPLLWEYLTFLVFLPIFNPVTVFLLLLALMPGSTGPNRFGPVPNAM